MGCVKNVVGATKENDWRTKGAREYANLDVGYVT
jgi:hypothetical protein